MALYANTYALAEVSTCDIFYQRPAVTFSGQGNGDIQMDFLVPEMQGRCIQFLAGKSIELGKLDKLRRKAISSGEAALYLPIQKLAPGQFSVCDKMALSSSHISYVKGCALQIRLQFTHMEMLGVSSGWLFEKRFS